MTTLKCKMCGGDLSFNEGAMTCECEYCGSVNTLPALDNREQRANLYNRANRLRMQCEFDKALSAYEKILDQDNADAEAHWGAVLSRWGIEYVKDPVNGERKPTCHRVQMQSILTDVDYRAAIEHAPDCSTKETYAAEARRIAEIQKDILAISQQEKPYDVFICYKETDENGQRTKDSTLAQDIYYQLTNDGYKVFFSRITLEDKLGQQYEPYIFAALNSAKVMLVIGTKPEYFEAVWVKNEWSRYLHLMQNDRSRLLIPCYRDMDPYDLPEALSNLQSQDMSKIGFMQDILRGVKKILDAKKEKSQNVVQQTVISSAPVGGEIAPLYKRATMFLEDGDFKSATEYADRILDIDPEYAPAYMVKVLSVHNCHNERELEDRCADANLESNPDMQKVIRFTKDPAEYKRIVSTVVKSAKFQKCMGQIALKCSIQSGIDRMTSTSVAELKRRVESQGTMDAQTQAYQTVAEELSELGAYPHAKVCAELCFQLVKIMPILNRYNELCGNERKLDKEGNAWKEQQQLALNFERLGNFRDAATRAKNARIKAQNIKEQILRSTINKIEKAEKVWEVEESRHSLDLLKNDIDCTAAYALCSKKINEIESKEEAARIAREKEEEKLRKAREKEAEARRVAEAKAVAFRRRIITISTIIVIVAVATFFGITQYILPSQKYGDALAMQQNGQFADAVTLFTELEGFKDSETQIGATYYMEAESLLESNDYAGANQAFINAGAYSDAVQRIGEPFYQHAELLYSSGDINASIGMYKLAGDYKDARAKYENISYEYGMQCYNEGNFSDAIIPLACSGREDAVQIAAELRSKYNNRVVVAYDRVYAITDNKDVLACGDNDYGLINVSTWKDIDKITLGTFYTLGLKEDGTVEVVFDDYIKNDHPEVMRNWTDITDIATDHHTTIALKNNGTVSVYECDDHHGYSTRDWKDITQIAVGSMNVVGLQSDGTIIWSGNNERGQMNGVKNFRNVSSITQAKWDMLAITESGSVLHSGDMLEGREDVITWTDMNKLIYGEYDCAFGLTNDGKVMASPEFKYSECEQWTDIVDIATTSDDFIVGLKNDGTVVAVGNLYGGLYSEKGVEVGDLTTLDTWENVIAIYSSGRNIVGLKADGTLLYVGANPSGVSRCSTWKLWE